MRSFKVSIVLLLSCILFSCKKDGITGGEDLFYYDYVYAIKISASTTADFVSRRVCYDLNSEKVVWAGTNTKYPNVNYLFFGPKLDVQYSCNARIGDHFIRIFAGTDKPFMPPDPTYVNTFNGVHFQKIDANTGEELLLKTIIPKSELIVQERFGISKVETDGTKVYFSCNNGYLYCYDVNGNQVWKKNFTTFPLYKQSSTTVSPGMYSFFEIRNNKIYIGAKYATSSFMNLKILDASTGSLLTDSPIAGYLERYPALLFTNNYMYTFLWGGIDVQDNAYTSPVPFYDVYPGNNSTSYERNPRAFNLLSEDYLAFIDYENRLAVFDRSRLPHGRAAASSIDCSHNQFICGKEALYMAQEWPV